jgi:mRNA deadenylase 3'-5' endonuclease subunit Ccr4
LKSKLENLPPILNRQFNVTDVNGLDWNKQFRVMQWNGLAKKLCSSVRFSNSDHFFAEKFNDWENFRIWRLLEEIVRYNSDIICLEEADFYEDIKHYLHYLG